MRKVLLLVLALLALGLAACGGSDVAYAPASWGPSGYCYYLYSPYECYGHHYGVPVAMPLYWHQRYAAYYDSPAYVHTYVPSRYRSYATTRSRAFERTYSSQIARSSRYATWRGSNGRTVPGTKVNRSATFGSGGARSGGFSGGARSSGSANPCAAIHYYLVSIVFVRGGSSGGGGHASSGGSSGGRASYGGGSARSGGSVGSKSGSRSGHNC